MEPIISMFEDLRDLLSQAIVESLNSWPELQRRIFTDIHYGGKSVPETARALGLSPGEVAVHLQECEHRLHQALRTFREHSEMGSAGAPQHFGSFWSSTCCFH